MVKNDPDVRVWKTDPKIVCKICKKVPLKLSKKGTPISEKCVSCAMRTVVQKPPKGKKSIVCEYCKNEFHSHQHIQRFCNKECRDAANNQRINGEWGTRKERPKPSMQSLVKIRTAHTHKGEPEMLKKFRVMRG